MSDAVRGGFDDPPAEPRAVAVIDGAMGCLDRRMTDNLAMIICRVPAPAVLLAVPRDAGSPRAGDLRLWRDLGTLLDGRPTRLLDLVVLGGRRTWSARAAASRRQVE